MKRQYLYFTTIFIALQLSVVLSVNAQTIIGPTFVMQGTTQQYQVQTSSAGGSFSVTGGAIITSQYSATGNCAAQQVMTQQNSLMAQPQVIIPPSGYCYTAYVNWGGGSGTVNFLVNGVQQTSINVTVCAPPQTPNTTFLIQNCGSIVIAYYGSPPAGSTWYWQTSATGTSTANTRRAPAPGALRSR